MDPGDAGGHRRRGRGGGGRGRGRGAPRGGRTGSRSRTDANRCGFSGNPADNDNRSDVRQRSDDGRSSGPARPRRPRRLGYKSVEALLQDDPTELVFKLSSSQSGFIELLNDTDIRRDLMALIINLISTTCEHSSTSQSLITLLNKVYTDSEFFTRHLTKYVAMMTMENQPKFIAIIPEQIKNIITILTCMLQRLPSSVNHVNVVVILLHATLPSLESKGIYFDLDLKSTLKRLVEFKDELEREEAERINRPRQRQQRAIGSTGPPPNDFREIPIFPTVGDFNTEVEPYLRKNIVAGGYTDVNEYLDVQFRLLREDFIEPLRSGIRKYQLMRQAPAGKKNQQPKDIRIYHDVEIQYPMCSWNGIIHRVHFDQTKFPRMRWQNSKRLIFGSLVCLSRDDFQTFLFATVANRKPEDLEQGFVDLRFEDRDMLEEEKNEMFVMAETSAYFEAYRHVLEGLQQITPDTLPLQNYIIDVANQVDAPEYLRQNPSVRYDLSPLVSSVQEPAADATEEDDIFRGLQQLQVRDRTRQATRASAVRIMDAQAWPSEEDLHLDSSQLEAVQMALTKELSVIQGPPGTGKTYIGLKIVQALLHNSRVWSNEDDVDDNGTQLKTHPLLIVCFTNHALDQFLEGILKFQAKDIVRIGGRSSSELLKSYNLNNIKQGVRIRRETQKFVHERSGQIRSQMMSCKTPMEVAQTRIAMTSHAILNEDNLRPYMSNTHYNNLVDFSPPPQNMREVTSPKMLLWLGLTGNFHVQRDDIFQQMDIEDDQFVESDEELDIDEEADLLEEQRMIDDQDHADRDIHQKGYDARHEFALDIDEIDKGESDEPEPGNEFQWQQVKQRNSRMKQIIKRNLQSKETLTGVEANTITNVWTIPDMPTRWKLYRYWLAKYQERQRGTLFENQENYERLAEELKEIRTEEDLNILNGAKVIGMTTTGAAKYRSMLQRIKPKIIVVEEAAEVLESHIVTTLSEDCQQLILIGDHQQLRPNPTVYKLAKDFNLDISLFERMVKNGLPCQKLTQQHRMRPEISDIMKLSHFYPPLLDHSSVKQFENIMGISSNVFFLDHDKLEAHVDDTKSHSNKHEAEFLVALTRYFLQQGYAPTQITILTTYTAQLFQFKNLMMKSLFKGVRVCAVDNFQGEENDIILLSLVRSNEEGNIGFLKVANRVCVALSRARKGLFCIGNFSLLSKQGQMWKDIVELMKRKGTFSTRLRLVCHNHPNTATEVSLSTDFIKVPEGGCNKLCEARLDCGHACAMPCHPRDPQHKEYKCLKPCTKAISGCPLKHKCSKFCYQQCMRKCTTSVSKRLPCGHTATVPCHLDVMEVVCQDPCVKPLLCGHPCINKCGEKCATRCRVMVIRSDLPCGHKVKIPCLAEAEDCPHPCGMELLCGHTCTGTCGKCQRGRLHMPCKQGCGRTLVCGHSCEEPCTKTCPPCKKPCRNRCVHSKCPRRCGDPCPPCTEPCEWQCVHKKCTKPCGEPCDRGPCNKPCPKILQKCRHKCIGVCGEPCPKKCRICDKEEVTEIFLGNEEEPDARFVQLEDCSHVIEVQALDNWMSMADQSVTGEKVDIQLKACPRCKTTIRKNLRYGNIIKKMLSDIESVKSRMFGNKDEIKTRTRKLRLDITRANLDNKLSREVLDHLVHQIVGQLTLEEVVLQENLFNLLSMIQTIRKNAEDITHKDNLQSRNSIQQQLKGFQAWLMRPRFRMSEQELVDVSMELKRLSLLTQMVIIDSRAREQGKQDDLDVQIDLTRVKSTLTNGLPLTDDAAQKVETLLERVGKLVGGISISDAERVSIVKAMGMSQGHWFKCPNGHIYAIGDCGGATIESTCPECKARIGGGGHKLRDDNKFAPEMDQAAHPAWSEQANMFNYQLP